MLSVTMLLFTFGGNVLWCHLGAISAQSRRNLGAISARSRNSSIRIMGIKLQKLQSLQSYRVAQ